MKVSYNWLKWYIDGPLPAPDALEQKIVFGAFEVEEVLQVADDWVFTIKTLPDRNHDCLSHQGIAREVAGLLGLPFKDPRPTFKIPPTVPTALLIDVAHPSVKRYSARIVRGVTVGPSPDWVVAHLASIGQRSINAIVDATNIVLFDMGYPTHVYDLARITGDTLIVRSAYPDEATTLLDGRDVALDVNDVVVSDTDGVLAVAGVKGATRAEVDSATVAICIEVGHFDAVHVRKTAKRLGVQSDAVKRFENEPSVNRVDDAMVELSALIHEMCPQAVFEEVVSFGERAPARTLVCQVSAIGDILGIALSLDTCTQILDRYNYTYTHDGDTLTITIPEDRLDIESVEHIADEIGRVYGYDRLPARVPTFATGIPETLYDRITQVKGHLVLHGYREVQTYTFVKKGQVEIAYGPKDKSALRVAILPQLMLAYEENKKQLAFLGQTTLTLFEVGAVFPSIDSEAIHVAWIDRDGRGHEVALDAYVCDGQSASIPNKTHGTFASWSVYPMMVRDIAFWLPSDLAIESLIRETSTRAGEHLARLPWVFDAFTNKEGRTSYGLRYVFQSHHKTLTESDIAPCVQDIESYLRDTGCEIR